jgi:hypothetical protein
MTAGRGPDQSVPWKESPAPPPPELGSHSTQSLGRWIDDLLGDSRHRNRARVKIAKLFEVTELDPNPAAPDADHLEQPG